jgi:hypothetical protein
MCGGMVVKTVPLKIKNVSDLKLLDYGKEFHPLHATWL